MERKEYTYKEKIQNDRNDFITIFILIGVAVLVVLLPFLPVYLARKFMNKINRRCVAIGESEHIYWVELLYNSVVFSLVFGAFYLLNSLFLNNGKIDMIQFSQRFGVLETYTVYLNVLIVITLPLLALYVMKIGEHFSHFEHEDGIPFAPDKSYYPLILLSLLPGINFLYYGIRGSKVSWFISGMLYLIPFAGLYFTNHNQFMLSGMFMFMISVLHTYKIRNDFLARIKDKNLIYILAK